MVASVILEIGQRNNLSRPRLIAPAMKLEASRSNKPRQDFFRVTGHRPRNLVVQAARLAQ